MLNDVLRYIGHRCNTDLVRSTYHAELDGSGRDYCVGVTTLRKEGGCKGKCGGEWRKGRTVLCQVPADGRMGAALGCPVTPGPASSSREGQATTWRSVAHPLHKTSSRIVKYRRATL